ncbi:CbtA family protein [Nocardioides sp.]|uniref:CbtA family protein n=1 Tax=Nocardioides sp. TaxID=35761 RepID=UPI002735F8A2|nr:CbtA family protein [Nocardioides sp.]MDP3892519.1 CbtA family protein [Nocardioides sp.]
MTIPDLVRRGVAAGAAAGALGAIYLWLVVEPVIERALVIEEARGGHSHGADGAHEGAAVVSRGVQVAGGLATTVVVAILFGVVFAIVFARVRHHLPAATDHGRSVVLAALAFGIAALLPALKIPANPPAVGDPDTVGRRTLIYLLVLLLGLAVTLGAFTLDRVLRARRLEPDTRVTAVAGAAVLAVVLILLLVPGSPDVVPDDVPATLLWEFRVVALGQLVVLWGALGLAFGLLVSRRSATVGSPRVVAR